MVEAQRHSETFGDRLRFLRQVYRLSLQQMADRLNVSKRSVCGWERGKVLPGGASIIQICNEFKVSADWLLFGEEE